VFARVEGVQDRFYEVLDVDVEVDVPDGNTIKIPLIRDEKGRLCVFSRLLALVAGYAQSSSIVRLMMRSPDFTEEYSHRLEDPGIFRTLREKMYERWPDAIHALERVRSSEALVFVPAFEVLARVSKMDFTGLTKDIKRVQDLLGGSEVTRDEVELDQFLSTLDDGSDAEPAEAYLPEDEVVMALQDETVEVPASKLYLKASQVLPPNTSFNSTARGEQLAAALLATGASMEFLEIDLTGMSQGVLISPFFTGFMGLIARKSPEKLEEARLIMWKTDHEFQAQDITRWLNEYRPPTEEEEPQEEPWTPPGFPEEFATLRDNWVVHLYLRILQAEAQGANLGANLPNISEVASPLFQVMGFLDTEGNPVGDGAYFLHRVGGELLVHKAAAPTFLWLFVAQHKNLDYRIVNDLGPMDQDWSETFKLDTIQMAAQRWVQKRSQDD